MFIYFEFYARYMCVYFARMHMCTYVYIYERTYVYIYILYVCVYDLVCKYFVYL